MSETTGAVELFDNSYSSGNLFAKQYPTPGSSSPDVTDINSIQSGTNTKDADITESIPFQEILGQHINNSTLRSVPHSQKPNHPALKSDVAEPPPKTFTSSLLMDDNKDSAVSLFPKGAKGIKIFQNGKVNETDRSGANEQILSSMHSADILSQKFVAYPAFTIQDFGKNPSLRNGENGKNADNTLVPNTGNENSTTFSLLSFSQGGSKGDLEGVKEIDVRQNKQFVNINNPDSLSPIKRPFLQDLSVRNTLPQFEETGLNILKNLKNPQALGESFEAKIQLSELGGSDINTKNIKELSAAFKSMAQNISPENKHNVPIPVPAFSNTPKTKEGYREESLSKINGDVSPKDTVFGISQTNKEQNLFDNSNQKQNTFDFALFGAHVQKMNSETPLIDTQMTNADVTQLNANDSQQNTLTSLSSGATSLFPIEGHKDNVTHIFYDSSNSGVDQMHSNIMEQIIQKISLVTHGDKSEIRVHLNPPELGNVKILFTEENDEIKAKIFVENTEVKAAIESNVHHLKESVATNGVEIQKLEVHIQNDDANRRKSLEDFNSSNSNNFQHQSTSPQGHDGDHLVDGKNINDNLKTEIGLNTSNLIIDYIL